MAGLKGTKELHSAVRIPFEKFILSFVSEDEWISVTSLGLSMDGDHCIFKGEAGEILRGRYNQAIRDRNVINIAANTFLDITIE